MRRLYTVVLFVVMASIDNTVLALLPTLTPRVREDLGVSSQALGLVIGLNLLVVGVTAVVWGYRSDQADRRRLLIIGTLAWVAPIALVPFGVSFAMLSTLMLLAGLGLGCVSTVGYSIITDLVPERWRGLIFGLWGLAQGIGALLAPLLVGLMPASANWRMPFGALAAVGLACSGLALFALSPSKGAADEALQGLDEEGGEYAYRISRADVPSVLGKRSNRWLIVQGALAQLTFGSLTWLTALLAAKLVRQGVGINLANGVAALLLVILQLGGIVSVFWGWVGDRLNRRSRRARALLAAFGFWSAFPCYLTVFWAPLPIAGGAQGSAQQIVLAELGRNGWWWVALVGATLATVAQATNAPNWFAMVSEVNLPEHRGTAFSFITLANSVGRAAGAGLIGGAFDWLERSLPAPANYALGLSLFQLFFIPAGLCFWLASRSAPEDVATVQATLRSRAAQAQSMAARQADSQREQMVWP